MTLHVLVIFITGLMVGNEFAIAAFVHPAISRLDTGAHAASSQQIAALLGRVMPFWYAAGLVALIAVGWRHHAHGSQLSAVGVAFASWVIAIVMTVTLLVPINNRIARLDPRSPHAGWQADRSRWDALHRFRVMLLAIAFLSLLAAG